MSLSVRAAAAEAPDGLAITGGGQALTWAVLAERVRRAAAGILARTGGAAPARVAFVAAPRVEAIVLCHALVELGACAVPLHPRATAAERRALLAEAAPVLFLDEDEVDALASCDPYTIDLAPQADDARPLALLFTSGSTGRPKGVVLSRAAFAASAAASAAVLGWRDDDRWLLGLPFAHVGGLSVLTRCLIARRAVVLGPGASFDADATLETLRRDRVTLASLVPAQLRRILDRPGRAPGSLRAVLLGGASAPPALVEEALARGWPALPTYGLTEACSQVATRRPGAAARGPRDCGPPLPGVEVRVHEGAIEVRGPTLLSGYHPPGDVPALDADGWLRTGDAGFLDEAGHLHVLGRRDRMIVTGGENVAPVEVEEALCACPGVAAACVFGVPDETWGQLVAAALVAADPAAPPDDATLLDAITPRLASFKRPRRIAWLAALQQLPSGKPDLQAIAAAAAGRLRPPAAR